MVLPPTGLTTLLHAAALTPEGVVDALQQHGCLAPAAARDPALLKTMVREVLEAESRRPAMPGPSSQDMLARALLASSFLNNKGHRLAANPPEVPVASWRSRLKGFFRSLCAGTQ